MKILQLKTAVIGQNESTAFNAVFADLKSKLPTLAPMLNNPNVQKLLIAVFDQVAANPSTLSSFIGDLKNIQTGRATDAKSTMPAGMTQGATQK